jgi:hypothetical protein
VIVHHFEGREKRKRVVAWLRENNAMENVLPEITISQPREEVEELGAELTQNELVESVRIIK